MDITTSLTIVFVTIMLATVWTNTINIWYKVKLLEKAKDVEEFKIVIAPKKPEVKIPKIEDPNEEISTPLY